MTIRVFMVDDHALVRAGMRMILSGETDIEVVGEADCGESALPLIRQLKPGGRMVIPVGGFFQELKVFRRAPDGKVVESWVSLLDLLRDVGQLSLRLVQCDSRLEPANHLMTVLPDLAQLTAHIDRHEHVGN